jgi:TonB family protein
MRDARKIARLGPCAVALLLVCTACRHQDAAANAQSEENDVPVAINSVSPFRYPPALFDQRIEGEVRLRLYVDSAGHVHPESTRVAASSGTPGLDSAAVQGSAQLQFAPAHRNGQPVGMAFYQPVIFHRSTEAPAPGPSPE